MNAVMFSLGVLVGLLFGAMVWEAFVAGPEFARSRRLERRLSESARAWRRMYLYAEEARVATSRAMFKAIQPETTQTDDPFSRKVTDLKVVQ